MFSSVITDDAVPYEPLMTDAEIDTASSTATFSFPLASPERPSFINGIARYIVRGAVRNDGKNSFVRILFAIILKKSRLNSSSVS